MHFFKKQNWVGFFRQYVPYRISLKAADSKQVCSNWFRRTLSFVYLPLLYGIYSLHIYIAYTSLSRKRLGLCAAFSLRSIDQFVWLRCLFPLSSLVWCKDNFWKRTCHGFVYQLFILRQFGKYSDWTDLLLHEFCNINIPSTTNVLWRAYYTTLLWKRSIIIIVWGCNSCCIWLYR